jgi:uncharacterized membrane protein YdjX (TVP38/TMEM64 family)
MDRSSNQTRRRLLLILAFAIVALALILAIQGGTMVSRAAAGIRDAARGASGLGPELGVYALAGLFTFLIVLLPLPAKEATALLNGTLFPPAVAFTFTWTFAMLGAAASYEIGRRFGRVPAVRLVGDKPMAWAERLVASAGWPTLLGLRLSPVMAYTAINWASGILALSRPIFYWTTAVGLLPSTFVFTVTPSLLLNPRSTALLVTVGLVVALGLIGFSVYRARRAGQRRM